MIADLARRRSLPYALMALLLLACGGPRSRMLSETEAEGEVERALELIAELPSWYGTRTFDVSRHFTDADVRAYVETARALRALEPESVRTAYQLIMDWAHGEGIHPADVFSADLYVLNRILFAAPEKVPQAEARDFADTAARQ